MKNLLILLLLLIGYTSYGQTGVLTNKYYISGSLSVGSGERKFADSSAYLEVGTDSSKKGVLLPRGNVSNINGKTGTYFHNYADSSLYSINGVDKIKQLNDRDTIHKLATKGELSAKISTAALATDANRRNDMAQVIYHDGVYKIFFNYFFTSPSDVSDAAIAMITTKDFVSFTQPQLILTKPSWLLSGLNPNVKVQPNGDLILIFTGWLSQQPDSLRTALCKSKLPASGGGWTAPEIVLNQNNRLSVCGSRIFDMGNGYWLAPYDYLVSGPGSSNSSLYYSSLAKSYDYGETWQATPLVVRDSPDNVNEPGIYFRPEQGYTFYFRSKASGELRKVMFGTADTAFANPSRVFAILPTQNAMSYLAYSEDTKLTYATFMRYLGHTTNRVFIDMAVSSDGDYFTVSDVVDHTLGTDVLNEPVIYFAKELNKLVVMYTKTRGGSAGYQDLMCKVYPMQYLNPVNTGLVYSMLSVVNRYVGTTSASPNNRWSIKLYSPRMTTDSAGLFIGSLSGTTGNDNTEWSPYFFSRGVNKSFASMYESMNMPGDNGATGLGFKTNVGDTGIGADFILKGKSALSVYSTAVKVPVSNNPNNYFNPYFGSVRMNPSTTTLQYTSNGYWKNATETFFYDLRLAKFATDSTYADTSMKNKLISVFDNTAGKYMDDTSFSMLPGGGFKFKTKKVTASDRFIARVESVWVDGLVPRYYPLDTIGKPILAVSFRKLRADYNGYACRLTSLADANSFIDVGFTPLGELDTFLVNDWKWKDTCYISRWYNQGEFSTAYFQSVTIPQGVRFRKINREIFAEYNGTSYMNTNNNSPGLFNFLHSGDSNSTANVVFKPTLVTTSSVYGLYGNNSGTTALRGISLSYDNRSAQSATNLIIAQVTNGTSGQLVVSNKYNNSGSSADAKSVIFSFLNINQATINKSRLFANGSTAVTNNTNSDIPSAGNAPTSFSLGSNGSNNVRMKGNIYEFILYAHELTEAQRISLHNNQNNRYQIYQP